MSTAVVSTSSIKEFLSERKIWLFLVLGLVLLGLSLQLELRARGNTYVRLIDLTLNIIVLTWAVFEICIRRSSVLSPLFSILAMRSIVNIYPLMKIMGRSLINNPSESAVEDICLDQRRYYSVDRRRCVVPESQPPCIFIANHSLWSIDDVSAIAALSASNLLVVMNIGASGIKVVPRGCRNHLCTIDREPGKGGSGFDNLKKTMEEEVLIKGKSLVIFPEDMKLKRSVGQLAPFRSGTFKLAKELNIPVIPMWISWPCQFPTILNSTEKVLRTVEGPLIRPGDFQSVDLFKSRVTETLTRLSRM